MSRAVAEKTASWGAVFSLLLAALVIGMTRLTGLLIFTSVIPLLFASVAVHLIVFLRLRLTRLAEEEARDQALAHQENPAAALFARDETAPFTAARTRRQLETYAIPWLAPLLGLLLIAWCWRYLKYLPWDLVTPTRLPASSALFGAVAFATFLLSRFQLGLSREAGARLLRGPGILTGLICWTAIAGCIGALATHVGFTTIPTWISWALLAATALIGAELVLNSLVGLYAHHNEPENTRYESRLGALLIAPGIVTRSVTDAMDYQFGISFSKSWFFQLIRRAILPLLLFQGAVLYAMSCFVFLAPHEVGIREQFGRPLRDEPALASGFHTKRPWPFESIRRVPIGRIHRIEIGFTPHPGGERPAVMTWTVPHYEQEDIFLLASPSTATNRADDASGVVVGMATLNLPIEFRITNAYQFAYRFAEPEAVMRQLAYRVVTRTLARHDLNDVMGPRRATLAAAMKTELQQTVDASGLGVTIDHLGLQGVHPPVPVADAFQSVVGALEEKEAIILEARAYTNQVLPIARAYADTATHEAEAYRHRRVTLAEAEAVQYEERLAAYRRSPSVFRAFHYLDRIREATANSRLYVTDLPERGTETLWLNLEEKQFSGVLDMAPLKMEGNH